METRDNKGSEPNETSAKGGFTIRRGSEYDAIAIADAHRASILEIGPRYYSEAEITAWGRQRDSVKYLKHMLRGDIYFVAESNTDPNYIFGFASVGKRDEQYWLELMYVRGTQARKGIGGALLKAVENHLRSINVNELFVESSLPGEAFYKASGFVEFRRFKAETGNTGVFMDAIELKKGL